MEFLKKICALDNICQWAERDSAIRESVSQHSFKVSALAVYLLTELEWENSVLALGDGQGWIRFRKDCVEYAVLHDFDEAILGRDISHTVKYNKHNGEEIRQNISNFVAYEMRRLGLTPARLTPAPNVKTFVKTCDWLALLSFIRRNEALGCLSFCEEKKYCQDKIAESFAAVQFILNDTFGLSSFGILVTILKNYVYG